LLQHLDGIARYDLDVVEIVRRAREVVIQRGDAADSAHGDTADLDTLATEPCLRQPADAGLECEDTAGQGAGADVPSR